MRGSTLDLQARKSLGDFFDDGLKSICGIPIERLEDPQAGVPAERLYLLAELQDVVWKGAGRGLCKPEKRE
jgi:hypothetical protein